MNLITFPLQAGDHGPAVADLLEALAALGLPVGAPDSDQLQLGRSTQQALLAFQKRENLDTTGEVDEATATRLNQRLDEQGRLRYRVSGRVLDQQQRPRPAQRVAAYDVDLRGAGRYATAKTQAELAQLGGLQPLGEATTDADGRYQLGFGYRQYGQAERGRADVVAFALAADGRVVGRSRLGLAADYTPAGELPGLDVALAADAPAGPTEWALLSAAADALLRESDLAWVDLAEGAGEQLDFLAQEVGQAAGRLAVRVRAAHRAREAATALAAAASRGGWQLAEELLYGIGRQGITLQWPVLAATAPRAVVAALQQAVARNIIEPVTPEAAKDFMTQLAQAAAALVLQPAANSPAPTVGGLPLGQVLGLALPDAGQQAAFLAAHGSFRGSAEEFWRQYLPALPEFKDDPRAIRALQLTSQLTALTGGHQPLVQLLQARRGIQSLQDLLDVPAEEWAKLLDQAGLPEGVTDAAAYAATLMQALNAAYPTTRIGRLLRAGALPVQDPAVRPVLTAFLEKTPDFDFATSRVADFADALKTVANGQAAAATTELLTVQRLFQVSPSPDALTGLKAAGFTSAYGVAQVPGQNFVRQYAGQLGGEAAAQAVHDRATYQATRLEYAALTLQNALYGATPAAAVSGQAQAAIASTIGTQLPNYAILFGSADACECADCQSVYSPAAYLVDVLRFLDRSLPNEALPAPHPPLAVLLDRRPDLAYLPLTCENTNTVIPYLDLVNEVLEYYTAHGQLDPAAAHDVDGATAAELRANPQYTEVEAYRKLADDVVYPFSLPYHQPLDTLRTYAAHLGTSRPDLISAFHPAPDATTRQALAAETLGWSEKEYALLTGQLFDGTAAATDPYQSYGYAAPADLLAQAGRVPELLARTGLAYADLVEAVKTRFLNPGQGTLDYLGRLFATDTVPPAALYAQLVQVAAGILDPATDPALLAALTAQGVAAPDFAAWLAGALGGMQQVVTLYEPDSKCDLTTTTLRTVQSVAENLPGAGLTAEWFGRLHRFVRVWRALQRTLPKGAAIAETDALLTALGEPDTTPALVAKLADAARLAADLKLPPLQLAAFWGFLDTSGPKSLYAQLFLNKAVQRLDAAFRPDALGRYLADAGQTLAAHEPALLAALRITADDFERLTAVLGLDPATAPLSLANVSQLYRYGTLAKAMRLPVADLCTLLVLLGPAPFSSWNGGTGQWTDIYPAQTRQFVAVVRQHKALKFKVAALNYLLTGQDDARGSQALPAARVYQTLHDLRAALTQLEADPPALDPVTLTADTLRAQLLLALPPTVVEQLLGTLAGTTTYTALADNNLAIDLPADLPALAAQVRYVKASGRLQVLGMLSTADRDSLLALPAATPRFRDAVAAVYAQPEQFVRGQLAGVFGADLDQAVTDLLARPTAPAVPLTSDQKLRRLYAAYLPWLKKRLRAAAVVQYVAALLGLDEPTTAVLLGTDLETLATEWVAAGLSADYFKDETFTQLGLSRTDQQVDFSWGTAAPDPLLPPDHFSVRWQGFVANGATTSYTFTAEVAEADEALRLWLDDQLVLEKPATDPRLSWETEQVLEHGRFYKIRLEYVDQAQKAGTRLSWRTEQTGQAVVPAANLYPAAVAEAFAQRMARLRQAALLVQGLGLTAAEVAYFQQHAADFAGFDVNALTAEHWRRMAAYATLRGQSAPVSEVSLLDLFAEASAGSPAPAGTAPLVATLAAATGWEMPVLTAAGPAWPVLSALVDKLGLMVADFRNEKCLTQLYAALQLVWKTSASVADLADWAAVSSDFDILNGLAQNMKRTTKARYANEDWLSVGGGLSDTLRGHQRDALVAYLLTRSELQAWGVADADGLFEYFLIDVQMEACMDTSRVKQSISSTQLFIDRVQLNLESRLDAGGRQVGVAPDAIDPDRWGWMKRLPVWQANRQLVVELESYLEPEWRDDKSEFFRELEGEMLQNDITDDTAETALRNYLAKLAAVANLRVLGMYEDADTQTLHVVARAPSSTQCYYRVRDKYQHWSAWSRVTADIRNVANDQGNGEDSGAHIIPVVWKKKLFLFWPEFMLKTVPNSSVQHNTIQQSAGSKAADLAPDQYWEMHLAWTELKDNKWTPKTLTDEFVLLSEACDRFKAVPEYSFYSHINDQQQLLLLATTGSQSRCMRAMGGHSLLDTVWVMLYDNGGGFLLTDSHSKVSVLADTYQASPLPASYSPSFMAGQRTGPLALKGNTYLQATRQHRLLFSNQVADFEQLNHPFFYWDTERSYFVTPQTITYWLKDVRQPDSSFFLPLVNLKVQAEVTQLPIPHELGPDDLRPNPVAWASDLGDQARVSQPLGLLGGGGLASLEARSPGSLLGLDQVALGGQQLRAARLSRSAADSPPDLLAAVFGDEEAVAPVFETRDLALAKAPLAASAPATPRAGFASLGRPGSAIDASATLVARGLHYADTAATASFVGGAFSGVASQVGSISGWHQHGPFAYQQVDKGLRFQSFSHPFTPQFEQRLNEGGLDGLLAADTELPDDGGSVFQAQYQPNTFRGYVQTPFPHQNVDFDEFGAYSLYNYELFFHIPLFLATRLSKNGQHDEALRWLYFIFDPTTNAPVDPANPTARYWQVLPFKTAPTDSIEDFFQSLGPSTGTENPLIAEWRDHPFQPHRLARHRPVAYMKNVVLKCAEILTAKGDALFNPPGGMPSIEGLNEATQCYVMAGHILGPKPQRLPRRGPVQAETFASLQPRLDDFANALVQLENVFPFSSAIPTSPTPYPGGLLGVGITLYFGIPLNQKMLKTWDTVADRLFKIRHCQNIAGVTIKLPLFEPPLDPGLLASALAQGMSLGAVLSDLSTPPPRYRFTYLLQRANEFCNEVKLLGNEFLQAVEKRDAEQLARQRAAAETRLLGLVREVKARAVLEATAQQQALQKEREATQQRLQYYTDLLGLAAPAVPAVPTLPADLDENSALPADTIMPAIKVDVDVSLVEAGTAGVKIIPKEKDEQDSLDSAKGNQEAVGVLEAICAGVGMIPTMSADGKPFGIGAGASFGGTQLAAAVSCAARIVQTVGISYTYDATKAAKMAAYIRRDQEWTQLATQAAGEIPNLDKRLTAAAIRVQMAASDLAAHDQQVLDAQAMEQWLQAKYTNQELYQWVKEQLLGLHKQTYQLACDLAKKAEKAYRFELGRPDAVFVQPGYWDGSHDGLLAGEQLSLALRQLESSYLDENRRDPELTKHVALAQFDPAALLQLRQTGACTIQLPEGVFDLDYPGHYFRRLKSVSVTIPCVAGPFTTINCTLRLLHNSIRIDTSDGDNGYPRNADDGQLLDDSRFVEQLVPTTTIATSSAQFDSGLFELNFRDERYLPFEGAGAISEWRLELGGKHQVGGAVVDTAQFDYNTITNVLLRLLYTAREDAGLFCQKAVLNLQTLVTQASDQLPQRLLLSMRQDFPTEWQHFLHPDTGQSQQLTVDVRSRLPYLTAGHAVLVSRIELIAATPATQLNSLTLTVQPAIGTTPAVELAGLILVPYAPYNGWLRTVPDLGGSDQPLESAWQLHYAPAAGQPHPLALEDFFLIVTYCLTA